MRTKKHRRGRCFLLAMPYSVCYDGKNTKKGENIMRKRCIALVLCLLTVAALAGCGGSSAKTVTSNGVECYRVDGVCYPAVFGEPQLTGEEITALLDSGDTAEMAVTVSTVPDALPAAEGTAAGQRGYRQSGHGDHAAARQQPAPRLGGSALYLLAEDYEESGRIDLSASGNGYSFCAIKQDGLYYAFDPFEIRGDCWLVLSGESYVNADAQKLADTLRENCDYSPFTEGVYKVNTYTLPDKETWALENAFKQREYTDEEIQQLAGAGLTLDEAADKLHTAEDAIRFLKASGYDPTKNNENPGAYFDDIWWLWGMPADCAYGKMGGSCRGTSNVMNHLLAGDYDEQGYVTYLGRHTFNYIKQDGVYYFCDFLCYINDGAYLLYACEDPHDFAEYYYTTVFPAEWNDPSDPNYLAYMYLYPQGTVKTTCA